MCNPKLKFIILVITLYHNEHRCESLLVLPCTTTDSECGLPATQPASSRIIGGQETQIGAWPWLVSLKELGFHSCGGAIIHQYFILTASHCLTNESNDPKRWQVAAGKHNILRFEQGQQIVKVKKIIFHELYNNNTIANDIALLLLEEPLNFTALVQPICLPSFGQGVSPGQMCLLAGWGVTKGTGNENVLNQVDLPVVSDNVCSQDDWIGSAFIPEATFCAGYEAGGKDGCVGDSGGPLIYRRGDRWYAQGVSSWGYACAEYKWPGIYTNVSLYSDWILLNVAAHIKCESVG